MMAMMVEQQQQLMMAAMSQFAGMGRGRGRHARGRGGRQGSRSLTYKRKEREETAEGQNDETGVHERRAATKQRGDEKEDKKDKKDKEEMEGRRGPTGEDKPNAKKVAKTVGGGAGTDAEARAKLMEETRKRIQYLERLAKEKKKEKEKEKEGTA
jgi:hypothetical protein